MPRRSELGWILVMVVVAVTLGFFIGGGPSLLTETNDGGALAVSATSTSSTVTTGPPPEESTTTTAPARAPGQVSVKVYNGSTTAGQAVRVGDRLKAAGYEVLAPGPSPADPVAASVIHFVDGFAAEAAGLAAELGLPATSVAPLPNPPSVRDVGPSQLVLIVADDLVVPAA